MTQNWKVIVHSTYPVLPSTRSSNYLHEFLPKDRAKQQGHVKSLHLLTHCIGRKIVRQKDLKLFINRKLIEKNECDF